MKVTINYEYKKINKFFCISEEEKKLPKDYIVYAIITFKKEDQFLIIYNNKLVFVPKSIVKKVDNKVEDDWIYNNYGKNQKTFSVGLNEKLKISRYLGPSMFLEDVLFIPDIVNDNMSVREFNFFYTYNFPYHTNNKYMLDVKTKKINLTNVITNTIVVKNVDRFKMDRVKKEIYIIDKIKNKNYFVINYETDEIVQYKNIEEMNVEHRFIFQYDTDYINLKDEL